MDDAGMTLAVQAWASFSKYLIDKYGMQKFLALYDATDGPIEDIARFNVHFKDIYGAELDVIDRDWRLFVLRYKGRSD